MGSSDEVKTIVADLEAAIVSAGGRIGEAGLRVSEVDVDIKTTLERKVNGEIDLKILKVGGGLTTENVNTVSISFTPREVTPFDRFEGEIVDALVLIQSAVATLEKTFTLSSASVEIAFTRTIEGKLELVLGGEGSRSGSHTATIKLKPAKK